MKYSGHPHYLGNILCAVDLECTGLRPGYHEPLQIAVVPLDINYEPIGKPFYSLIAPEFPERANPVATGVHRLDPYAPAPSSFTVTERLLEWMKGLDLPDDRCILPLAHNWAYEASFLKMWLGMSLMQRIFHGHARDGMLKAIDMNDMAARAGKEIPFKKVGLPNLAAQFGIEHNESHDALADCITEAKVYARLMTYAPA